MKYNIFRHGIISHCRRNTTDTIFAKAVLALGIFIAGFIIIHVVIFGIKTAEAHDTTMTASVRWNNCNLITSHIPPPQITHAYLNEYNRYNMIALVGSSTLFAVWKIDYTLNFFLEDAYWSVINGKYIKGKCVL